jgi:hypothetical protein
MRSLFLPRNFKLFLGKNRERIGSKETANSLYLAGEEIATRSVIPSKTAKTRHSPPSGHEAVLPPAHGLTPATAGFRIEVTAPVG